jgi:tetratricopeptide (TPR) repeat protein
VTPAAAAALIAVALYANSLPNGFTYDDLPVVARNEATRDPTDLRRIFLASSWTSNLDQTIAFRPLTTWTFALGRALHGEGPLGHHVVNVLGHAAVSALVAAAAAAAGATAATATMAGVLFAAHPIHTETVANVVGRAEILAAAFGLLAILLRRRGSALGSGLSVAAYGLALLAKEHALAFLALLPLADALLDDRGSPRTFLRRLPTPGRGAYYGALVLVTLAYLGLRLEALGGLGVGPAAIAWIPDWQNVTAHAPTGARVLTALWVTARACWLLLVPLHLSADYSFAEITLVESVADPRALAGIAVAGGLLALAYAARRQPAALFWLLFGLLPFVTVSNLIVPSGTIFGERLLYLPSAAVCVAAGAVLMRWTRGSWRTPGAVAAAVLLLGFAARTVSRNPVWRDNLALARATVADAPRSVQAHALLATALMDRGEHRDALREFDAALAIYPDHIDALFNAGVAHMLLKEDADALRLFDRVIALEPKRFAAWVNEAAIRSGRREYGDALEAADRAVALQPNASNGHIMRGFALRGLGRLAEARTAFQTALRHPPVGADALLGFGATALDLGDAKAAAAAYEHLVQVAPSAEAYRGLVVSYQLAGRDVEARQTLEDARRRFPGDPALAPP